MSAQTQRNPVGGFGAYILARRITDTPQGDHVVDARSNRDFPDAGSLDELLTYIRRRGGCREARAAARLVWAQFLRWRAVQQARAAQEEPVT